MICKLSALAGVVLVLILFSPFASRAGELPTAPDWAQIRHIAASFVARESPPGVLPFESPAGILLRAAPHTTLAQYFPPYPLSTDNVPADSDAYNRLLLNPNGGVAAWPGRDCCVTARARRGARAFLTRKSVS